MKSLIYLIIILFSLKSFAKEQVLVTLTNDNDSQVYRLIATLDDVTDDLKSFSKESITTDKKIMRTLLSPKELHSLDGLVLDQEGKYNVLTLKSDNFDLVRGGTIFIDSLYNGANGERKEYQLELSRDKTGWRLWDCKRPISKLHIEVNKKLILGIVGVKNIRME